MRNGKIKCVGGVRYGFIGPTIPLGTLDHPQVWSGYDLVPEKSGKAAVVECKAVIHDPGQLHIVGHHHHTECKSLGQLL